MIFAAGLGTRLKPLTDTMPKALVPVAGQPLLWHVVQKLKAAGFGRIVINVHHFAQQIVDYLQANKNFGIDIQISDETDGLLETGGGIKKALPLFDDSWPVLIHNVDILSNVDLAALYDYAQQSRADALLLVSQRKTKRYLLFDDEYLLDGWTNIETGEVIMPPKLGGRRGLNKQTELHEINIIRSDPQPPNLGGLCKLAFSGIHVVLPHVFPLFSDMPSRFGIIDFYLKYCHQCAFLGYKKKDLRLMDVGKLDTLSEAEAFLQDVLAK